MKKPRTTNEKLHASAAHSPGNDPNCPIFNPKRQSAINQHTDAVVEAIYKLTEKECEGKNPPEMLVMAEKKVAKRLAAKRS